MDFALFCKLYHIPTAVAEYRFHESRRWRFDFAWPDHRLALEIEGGVWTRGRHFRGKGAMADMEKYNEATLAGWRVIRVIPSEATSAHTASLLIRGLG